MNRWRLAVGVVGAAAALIVLLASGRTEMGHSVNVLRLQPAMSQLRAKETTHVSGADEKVHAVHQSLDLRERELVIRRFDVSAPPKSSTLQTDLPQPSQKTTSARESVLTAAESPGGSFTNEDSDVTNEDRIVTIDTVDSVFKWIMFCNPPTNCDSERDLARRILGEPKRESDSWAYGMEFEMRNALDELLAEDPKTRGTHVLRQVTCNAHGCFVYREEPLRLHPNYGYWLKERLRERNGIEALNDNGNWPRTFGLLQGKSPDKWFEIIVFRR